MQKIKNSEWVKDFSVQKLLTNIQSNWFVPISELFFFYFQMPFNSNYTGIIIALICSLILCSIKFDLLSSFKQLPKILKIHVILCAIGACYAGGNISLFNQTRFYILGKWTPTIVGYLWLLLGIPFAVTFIGIILNVVWNRVKDSRLLKRISIIEWVTYGVLFISLISISAIAFLQSSAFYRDGFDIIYTTDSPQLMEMNVYALIGAIENDIRQPLFAVFTLPFTGGIYLLAELLLRCFSISDSVYYVIINIGQLFVLIFANALLVDMMDIKKSLRILFLILLFSTYAMLSPALILEQYVVSYFWLIFTIYIAKNSKKLDMTSYCGAVGTLLTSCVILPVCQDEKMKVKEWISVFIKNVVKAIICFLFLVLLFNRFDVIKNSISTLRFLSDFTGKSLSFMDKYYRYINLFSDCFIAPVTEIKQSVIYGCEYFRWHLVEPTTVNLLGLIILVLCILSVYFDKNDWLSKVCGYWILFSIGLILVIGWGTAENGVILYSLYFCWAIFVLLFKLVVSVSETIKFKYLPYIVGAICFICVLYTNIGGISDMLQFAISYYPV